MRKILILAAAAAWLPITALLLSAQTNPSYKVEGPTILAFFSPVTQSEPKDAGSEEALADFQFYGLQASKELARMGVKYKEVQASSFVVKVGNATKSFRSSEAVGYYFIAPGRKPHVEYGVMTNDDLVKAAHNYFGVNEKER